MDDINLARVDPEALARFFHTQYELLAPRFGYETRIESAVAWDEVPTSNRLLMTEVSRMVLKWLPGYLQTLDS